MPIIVSESERAHITSKSTTNYKSRNGKKKASPSVCKRLIQILTRRDMSSSFSCMCVFFSLSTNHNIIFAATNDIIVFVVTIK